ncbi:MAG: ACT domain-containing protein [Actinobacteria bacterium]|nr:ACT domain-containing protein [Actinomycetota bacterium]
MSSQFAVAVVGGDRPGIAAALAAALHKAGANIEDSRMSILGGRFAVMMLVSLPDGADLEALRGDLAKVRDSLGLDAAVIDPVEGEGAGARPDPTHVLTVYGADHPGIVHAVCAALAERQVNIDDLATRLIGSEDAPVYTLICELTLPAGLSPSDLTADLTRVGEQQGVEVVLRELDQDIL